MLLEARILKKQIENRKGENGIEFIFFSHWLRHIHRKILIVDEKIAFIGSVNIGKRFNKWNDLQLEIRGKIVKAILKSFAYTYMMAGGKNYKILNYRKKKITTKLKFWLIEHWPIRNIYTLKKHYVEKIMHAEKKIQIVTPYFNPPRWLISLLDDARRRGVEIEILIPKKVDWNILTVINYHYMNNLYPLGIKFYLANIMNHSKLLVIDDKEGLLGSQNIDLFSFRINAEAGIFFKDKKLLNELENAMADWKKNSSVFHPHRYKMKFTDYIIVFFLKIIKPIL